MSLTMRWESKKLFNGAEEMNLNNALVGVCN